MEVLERHEVHRARLQELQDERQRKREEQLAKEEAAMERRRMLESERVAKVMEQEVNTCTYIYNMLLLGIPCHNYVYCLNIHGTATLGA